MIQQNIPFFLAGLVKFPTDICTWRSRGSAWVIRKNILRSLNVLTSQSSDRHMYAYDDVNIARISVKSPWSANLLLVIKSVGF